MAKFFAGSRERGSDSDAGASGGEGGLSAVLPALIMVVEKESSEIIVDGKEDN